MMQKSFRLLIALLGFGLFALSTVVMSGHVTAIDIPIIGNIVGPKCFIQNGDKFTAADCHGTSITVPIVGTTISTPDFQAIWNSYGGGDLGVLSCYRITNNAPGIEEQPLNSDTCKTWVAGGAAAAAPGGSTPGATGGSTPGTTGGSTPGTTGGSTPAATGSAPTANNPAAPPPAEPAIKDRCTTVDGKPAADQSGCGFESTNNCQAGNQGKDCSITDRLNTIANFLSAGVGIIIVIMIIIGGIQYTTAGGDPGRVAAAKQRILNAIYALIAFIFLYAFLQWIVPGGLF